NEPHPVDTHVASRMRERRIELGISQPKLATALGVAYQQLSKYERAKNRMTASRLYDLSRVLGVPVTFFFEGFADAPTPAAPLESGGHTDPLGRRETVGLFAAYRAISDPVVRRRIRQLVRGFASEPNASTAPNPVQSQSRERQAMCAPIEAAAARRSDETESVSPRSQAQFR